MPENFDRITDIARRLCDRDLPGADRDLLAELPQFDSCELVELANLLLIHRELQLFFDKKSGGEVAVLAR